MSPEPEHEPGTSEADADPVLARQVYLLMSDLVIDNERRRQVSDALGINFGRVRALRRVARKPRSMGELATMMGIDRPNATVLVDDLEAEGLVRRLPHPTDRRTKLVEATPKGAEMAYRADEILSTPPPALAGLSVRDLNTLKRILKTISEPGRSDG